LVGFQYTSTLPITPTGAAPFTWQVPPLAPGTGGLITITGVISAGLSEGYTFTNTAHIASAAPVQVIDPSDDTANAVVRLNTAPQAVDDVYTTLEDMPLSVVAPGVMQNDMDIDGDALSALLDTPPITGELSLAPEGGFTFQPAPNANGLITFTYHLTDGLAESNVALVTLEVTPVNDPPVAVEDRATTPEDTPTSIAVLANDFDIDGDALSLGAVGQPRHGSTLIRAAQVVYTPTLDFNGLDVYTYTVSDGQGGADTGWVTITVAAVNDTPLVEAGPDQTAVEGEIVAFQGSYSDDRRSKAEFPLASVQIEWDFGDGITVTGTLTPTHTFTDDGVYTVTLTVTDSLGAAGQDALLVSVENIAPLLAYLPDRDIQAGGIISLTAVFTDPGLLDIYMVTIDWQAGISETLALPAGARTFTLAHRYNQPGHYWVTVWIADDDGGTNARSFDVIVRPWRLYLPVMRKP
jgi:hypothetical protein